MVITRKLPVTCGGDKTIELKDAAGKVIGTQPNPNYKEVTVEFPTANDKTLAELKATFVDKLGYNEARLCEALISQYETVVGNTIRPKLRGNTKEPGTVEKALAALPSALKLWSEAPDNGGKVSEATLAKRQAEASQALLTGVLAGDESALKVQKALAALKDAKLMAATLGSAALALASEGVDAALKLIAAAKK